MKSATASSWLTAGCASPAPLAARSTFCQNDAGSNLDLSRRSFLQRGVGAAALGGGLLGAGALGLAPGSALAAGAARRFELTRGGDPVGFHTLEARETAEGLAMKINIFIEVRFFGVRVYVYEHENNELWRDGQLVRLVSQTNDDGTDQTVKVERQGDALRIDGPDYRGEAPADAAPSSYWNYANFKSSQWFSSQTGKLFNVKFRSRPEGPLERWDVSGDFSVTLIYDGDQEWRGCRFDARGEPIVYRQSEPGAAFGALV